MVMNKDKVHTATILQQSTFLISRNLQIPSTAALLDLFYLLIPRPTKAQPEIQMFLANVHLNKNYDLNWIENNLPAALLNCVTNLL